jgi:hypothetical protein
LTAAVPPNARGRCCYDCSGQQPPHIAQPAEAERETEIALDQPCRKQSFARIGESEKSGAPDVPVAHQIGNDSRDNHGCGDRQSCVAPKRDQHAGGQTGSRPEQGNAIGFGEQRKAQLRCEEIGNANRDGEPDRSNPRQRRVGAPCAANFLGWILQDIPHPSLLIQAYITVRKPTDVREPDRTANRFDVATIARAVSTVENLGSA